MSKLATIAEKLAVKQYVEEVVKEFVLGMGFTYEEVRMEVFQAGFTGEMRWETVCKIVKEITRVEERYNIKEKKK